MSLIESSWSKIKIKKAISEFQEEIPLKPRFKTCIICLGATGAGKSSTISRYTRLRAPSSAGFERETKECKIYYPDKGPVWIDTVGWDDVDYDNETLFQDLLRFLKTNQVNRIQAIIWNIVPNIKRDSKLLDQAQMIQEFGSEIWKNVIVICKQSMNPERDGVGAIKSAEQVADDDVTSNIQVIGYSFLSSLDETQYERMQDDEKSRKAFNICNDDEVKNLLQQCLDQCNEPVSIIFQTKKCQDCGAEDDPRLLSPYCHMESHFIHPKIVQIVHPDSLISYHKSNSQIRKHDGDLYRPWYGILLRHWIPKRYSCCHRKYYKPGCLVQWSCCGNNMNHLGCAKKYQCCGEDQYHEGCQPRFLCCNSRPDEKGCVLSCKKCSKEWGTSADKCFKKSHSNLVDIFDEETDSEENFSLESKKSLSIESLDEKKKFHYYFGIPPLIFHKLF